MDRGDLSNDLAPAVGVRFEHVLYNFGKVNEPGKAYVESLLRRDINLYLYTTLPDRKVRAWCYHWGVLYTRVISAESTLEIPELCRAHKLMLYVDTDDHILQAVSERGNPQIQIKKWEQPIDEYREGLNTEISRGGRP